MSVDISVLIDTFNHEKYIRAAIESVLAQEALGDLAVEIVVVDDGSKDGTGEIVKSFGDKIRYFYKRNGGQASAFNFGIPLCQGEIICFLDGDDWWHPTKLDKVIEAFRENPATCAVGHSIVEVDEVGGNSFSVGPNARVSINFSSPNSIVPFHKFACCLGTSRLSIKRSYALALLNIPETLVFEADEYMFTLLPAVGEVIVLPEALTYYRIHGANLYQDSRVISLKGTNDPRLAKRASIYDSLSKQLPFELEKRGCNAALIDALLKPVHVQASRLKLMTQGGTRLENFKCELLASNVYERNGSLVSRMVLWISLGLTLILPPKSYFRVKQIYSNLQRRSRHRSLAQRGTST